MERGEGETISEEFGKVVVGSNPGRGKLVLK